MTDPIDTLTALFEKFPGIGPRQAGRFVQFLLRSSPALRHELAESVKQLSGSVHRCSDCQRFFSGTHTVCGICANSNRDTRILALIATDADLIALERSGTYSGRYFVLGGTIHLANEKAGHLRIAELLASLPQRMERGLTEIILAFPANPEGDATAIRIRDELSPRIAGKNITLTSLGRGLSTGSELEYADPETLKSALQNRK